MDYTLKNQNPRGKGVHGSIVPPSGTVLGSGFFKVFNQNQDWQERFSRSVVSIAVSFPTVGNVKVLEISLTRLFYNFAGLSFWLCIRMPRRGASFYTFGDKF